MSQEDDVLEVGVAEFKARCTQIMPHVAKTGRMARVLKRGRVLVEIHPPAPEAPRPFIGRLKGTATFARDLIDPVDLAWAADTE